MSSLVIAGDTSGTITLQAPAVAGSTTIDLPATAGTMLTDVSDITTQVKTATNASGSAPIYSCRAWVNFNGTGTVAIRASGNVSSITDNGTGNYTVNFTTALTDANYCCQISAGLSSVSQKERFDAGYTTTSITVRTSGGDTSVYIDVADVHIAIFR